MTEKKEISALAKSAFALLRQDFQQRANILGDQVLQAMGLQPNDGWTVDFNTGVVFRDVPDAPKAESPKRPPKLVK